MSALTFNRFESLPAAVNYYSTELDHFAGQVRQRFAFSAAIDEEYQLTAQQAQAYIEAGYTGTPGDTVQSWADATGQTAAWSADNIIETRDLYLTALEAVRRIRLVAKAQMVKATTVRDVAALYATARAELDSIVAPP